MTEKEKKNREGLLKLMQENPDLPVVPMVEGGGICDYYAYILYALGSAYIDEYVLSEDGDQVLFKADADVWNTLGEYLSFDEFEKLPENESECKVIYDALPWKKAIILYIDEYVLSSAEGGEDNMRRELPWET